MKSKYRKLLMFVIVTLTSLHLNAHDFEVNGIYYNVVSLESLTCEVSSPNEEESQYSGIISVPSEVTYKGRKLDVIGIGNSAFYDCENLKEVLLPESITSIGSNAFRLCYNLEQVNLPASISSIGERAFEDCRKLSSVIIPTSLAKLNSDLFKGCYELKEIVIPANIQSIGSDTFSFSGIEICIIEDSNEPISLEGAYIQSVDFIHSGSFSNAKMKYLYLGRNYNMAEPRYNSYHVSPFLALDSIEEVVIGGLVTELPANTFAKGYKEESSNQGYRVYYEPLTSLTKITFKESPVELKFITGVWGNWYSHISETSIIDLVNVRELILERNINWEDNIGKLGGNSIFSKYMEHAELIKECTTVNENMFDRCTHLRTIILGENIKNINHGSFERTDSLLDIRLLAINPPSFNGTPGFSNNQYLNAKLYVPKTSLESYKLSEVWKDFWDIEESDFSASTLPILYDKEKHPIGIYNSKGILLKKPQKGINIIMYSDGTIEKILY